MTTIPSEAVEEIASQIMSEVWAQLDDLSDDTYATLRKHEREGDTAYNAAVLALAEDFRLTLMATVDQRHDDWLRDHGAHTEAPVTVCPHEVAHTHGTCPSITRDR
jgi:acyl-CoA thioesterase